MKITRSYFFCLVPALTLSATLCAQDIVIQASSNPLAGKTNSLQQAWLLARESRQSSPGKKITIVLHPGTYYLDSTLVLTPADNNTTWRSDGNGLVTISGGKKVLVKWTPWKNGIYKASLDVSFAFDQLYINDVQQVRARYPNYDSSASHYNGTAADAISSERVKTWQHPVGGYIHALHRAEWGGYHYRITGVNADGTLQLEGGYQNNRQMGMHDKYRFVENIFEELDAPREWYYNKDTKTLYYKPAAGVNLQTATVVVSRLPQLIVLKGNAAHPVSNVSFEGIRFAHSAPTFMDTREPLLRSDWAIYRGGAVLLDGTRDCSIRDCEFDHNGGNAVFVSNYNRHANISACHIHDAGGSGICFVGNPDAVRSPLFEYNQSPVFANTDTARGPKSPNYPDSCVAYNNLIYRTGRIEKQTAGVEISMAMEITVSHNTIYDLPRAGINVSEGTWGGHLITFNDVFNTVLETGDHGAFNSWGRDRWWYPDRHEMDSMATAYPWMVQQDAIKTNVLCNNRFRCDHGWDIDLDDGSSNYRIYNNVCLNGGLKLREGFHRIVENNIILNNSFHPHVWFENSHDVFRHNIVSSSYKPIGIKYWGDEIDYNLFPDKAAITTPTDAHSLAGDPLFMAPAAGDYRVKAGSPALQVGFENFPMDQFGVVSPSLKALAKKALLPVLHQEATNISSLITWRGAKVKNIETLGERSATGLPDNKGAYFVAVPAGFPYGLQTGDVLLQVGEKRVNNVTEMIKAFVFYGDKKVKLIVFRNQQRKNL
ncbi:parallel beta helix pectate lyase-like protein [Chitinophaga niastensis]|uniref:Parallel beta helix pectate lyase-like protein n=1 Tax=Chitinophaga niastensis TaxID=536980 RepID=A0A2P8HIX4_CHINA|nr:PDZ domain-containing protein [Chitinophaga niastensis]PSL46171.1 parallel beta helix pectate lyase-like protein [Chitinophaga niastensis]